MMLIHRAVARAAALACILVALGQPIWVSGGGSSFRVEQDHLDLGAVVAGETVTATFVFHNDGPGDVHIIRAKPS